MLQVVNEVYDDQNIEENRNRVDYRAQCADLGELSCLV